MYIGPVKKDRIEHSATIAVQAPSDDGWYDDRNKISSLDVLVLEP
jgi:hypothetical protein